MSAPAQKARSPAPVNSTARTARVAVDAAEGVDQLRAHDRRPGVELLRPVQRDGRDRVRRPRGDLLVRHRASSLDAAKHCENGRVMQRIRDPVVASLACDSLVALGGATADGAVLFAKNSDRPAHECQPLVQLAAQRHAPGDAPALPVRRDRAGRRRPRASSARVRTGCGASSTGSTSTASPSATTRSSAKDALGGHGLIGMDLVRLGLERARSARGAAEVISGAGRGARAGRLRLCRQGLAVPQLVPHRRPRARRICSRPPIGAGRCAACTTSAAPAIISASAPIGTRSPTAPSSTRSPTAGGTRTPTGASTSPPRIATPAWRRRSSRAAATAVPASCSNDGTRHG